MAYFKTGGGVAASQQFGLTQTDVFSVNENGQLTVNWVDGAGPWTGPAEIGPANFAPAGCPLAACRQFGLSQTDVFLVDNKGQLSVFWVDDAGAWGGPVGIGSVGNAPAGANIAVSQQFGANNQTDVFLIDNNGQLNVFYVNSAGPWNGPVKIGPTGLANPGAPVAASQQFGIASQTDVFVVGKNGQLNVFWVDGTGPWGGPVGIGGAGNAPAGAGIAVSQQFGANNQTDVFLIDNNGQLNVFYVNSAGPWNGPVKIGPTGLANPGAPVAASQQFGIASQTDVFVVGKNGQLNVFWVDGVGAWGGPGTIGSAANSSAGASIAASQQFGIGNQTDVFLIDKNANLDVFWVNSAGPWSGPVARGPVAAPSAGLGSNSNYYLWGGLTSSGKYIPLLDLVVTIDVTQDIVGTPPFNFQLNAYSPHNELDGWQQYGISMAPGSTQLNSFAENWPLSGNNLFNIEPSGFVNIPNQTTIPAGYRIVVKLTYAGDGTGNVNGSVVTVFDGNGTSLGSQTISLIGQPLAAGGTISEADLAPIISFQLNLVAWANSEVTALTSGAGTISYSSSTPMTAQNGEPSDAESGYITAETANSTYDVLFSGASNYFVQAFGVSAGKQPISRKGKLMHNKVSRFTPPKSASKTAG